jgi:hypothetical protein
MINANKNVLLCHGTFFEKLQKVAKKLQKLHD